MNASGQRRRASLRGAAGSSTPPLALQCARNVYQTVDRRMPEAAALAGWLAENAAGFGLPESAVPDDYESRRPRRGGVAAADWHKVGTALATAAAPRPDAAREAVDRWIAAIRERLALDALEARILALALHYRLDDRGEGLCDAISECRGRRTRFMRDAGMIALLLSPPRAAVAIRLAGEAKLLASGVLHLGSQADLSRLERLTSLIRRDIRPVTDM